MKVIAVICTGTCALLGCVLVLAGIVWIVCWILDKWTAYTNFGRLVKKHAWNAARKEAELKQANRSGE